MAVSQAVRHLAGEAPSSGLPYHWHAHASAPGGATRGHGWLGAQTQGYRVTLSLARAVDHRATWASALTGMAKPQTGVQLFEMRHSGPGTCAREKGGGVGSRRRFRLSWS